jgi:hypothetical protein
MFWGKRSKVSLEMRNLYLKREKLPAETTHREIITE